jgi:chromosome segregation ATPase
MNVKEVASLTGLTHQAIYKRIKAAGYKLDELKDKATGQFTPEGETVLREMFKLDELQPELTTEVEELTTRVAELTTEVEKLRNQVTVLETQNKALTEERDFLRVTLEHSQQLQAATLAKVPSVPALPDGSRRGLRGWWARIRGKDGE